MAVPAGLLVLVCLGAYGMFAARTTANKAEQRRVFRDQVSTWVSIPGLDRSILDRPTGEVPPGYVRGKVALVDYDRASGTGKLHPWHTFRGYNQRLALSPGEVETVFWLEKTVELVGRYEGLGGGEAREEILTVTVIDLPRKSVVGQFTVRGEAPNVARANEDHTGRVEVQHLFRAVRKLPPPPGA